ncbi:hypothetical protein [Paraburkholderia sp.]|uniref:hypothetical protein n=1 Tax=Paraburkholderia sp. TaxID=1926495 RepID=UPI003978D709
MPMRFIRMLTEGGSRMVGKNRQTINEFLLYTLKLELTNRTRSWDAYGEDVVVLKLWEKQRETLLDGTDRIEVWTPRPWRKFAKVARNERRHNIDRLNAGGATYAVLRRGNGFGDREAWGYESDRPYKLNRTVVDQDGHEYAIEDRSVCVATLSTDCAWCCSNTSVFATHLESLFES